MEFFKGAKGSWIWLVIRLYLGYQWLNAGWHKVTGETPFSAAGMIKGAIAKAVPASPGAKPVVQGWWANFLESFALPNISLFNFMVQYGEVLVGLALILGFATLFAATMGALMNFAFLMSGTVSTNPNLFALSFLIVAFGGAYAGYLGVDYWFRPWFRSKLSFLFDDAKANAKAAA
ncbi:MAG TPA: DoxX family membrane protein [Symbiobacteriaceae bacterium]|jgi:thiosulfate dehydrogenase (quinone) large subunit|nr:DoxX family membrane protein [Symbiobacteriaceae bacterium]